MQTSLMQRSQTFLRICADPRSADLCIVLVRSVDLFEQFKSYLDQKVKTLASG